MKPEKVSKLEIVEPVHIMSKSILIFEVFGIYPVLIY
jgi:hypothetical protein